MTQRHELHSTKKIYHHIADKGLGAAAHYKVCKRKPAIYQEPSKQRPALKIFKNAIKGKRLKKPLARLDIFNFLTRPTKYTCQLLFAQV